eukprot:1856565-Pleurochrysis_carterae.AAC.2
MMPVAQQPQLTQPRFIQDLAAYVSAGLMVGVLACVCLDTAALATVVLVRTLGSTPTLVSVSVVSDSAKALNLGLIIVFKANLVQRGAAIGQRYYLLLRVLSSNVLLLASYVRRKTLAMQAPACSYTPGDFGLHFWQVGPVAVSVAYFMPLVRRIFAGRPRIFADRPPCPLIVA